MYGFGHYIKPEHPVCSRKYLVYNTSIGGIETIVYVRLKDYSSNVLANDKKIPVHADKFFLEGNTLYTLEKKTEQEKEILYRYNLFNNKAEQLLEIEVGLFNHSLWDQMLKYSNYLVSHAVKAEGLLLWYVNLNDVSDTMLWEVPFSEYEGADSAGDYGNYEWGIQKYVVMIDEDNDKMFLYDILERKFFTLVDQSQSGHYYVSGVLLFKERNYTNDIEDIQVINNTLYYRLEDNTIYKTPINEHREEPECL